MSSRDMVRQEQILIFRVVISHLNLSRWAILLIYTIVFLDLLQLLLVTEQKTNSSSRSNNSKNCFSRQHSSRQKFARQIPYKIPTLQILLDYIKKTLRLLIFMRVQLQKKREFGFIFNNLQMPKNPQAYLEIRSAIDSFDFHQKLPTSETQSRNCNSSLTSP